MDTHDTNGGETMITKKEYGRTWLQFHRECPGGQGVCEIKRDGAEWFLIGYRSRSPLRKSVKTITEAQANDIANDAKTMSECVVTICDGEFYGIK